MKIYASVLAADPFNLENWLKSMVLQGIDGFHIDLIDPTFANFLGLDSRIVAKMADFGLPFVVHYMSNWNDKLIQEFASHNPEKMFFHAKKIENWPLFEQLDAGLAIELGENPPKIEVKEYTLMNVKLGYCGQNFDPENLELSKNLQKRGKIITSDGGINLLNLAKIAHFDKIVIGNGLKNTTVQKIKEKIAKIRETTID